MVSGSLDTSIRVWDVETGNCIHTLTGHQSLTSGMELKDNILVSGNADSTVKIWDIKTGQCLQTLQGEDNWETRAGASIRDQTNVIPGYGTCMCAWGSTSPSRLLCGSIPVSISGAGAPQEVGNPFMNSEAPPLNALISKAHSSAPLQQTRKRDKRMPRCEAKEGIGGGLEPSGGERGVDQGNSVGHVHVGGHSLVFSDYSGATRVLLSSGGEDADGGLLLIMEAGMWKTGGVGGGSCRATLWWGRTRL